MNTAVSGYSEAAEALARRFVGRNGAELDDLKQEGLIFVWRSLEKGAHPSAEMIENRMRTYVRWLGRQTPIPYETMLPLEDIPGGAGE